MTAPLLECVINVSEGRDQPRLRSIAGAAGPYLIDVHSDPDHHRSVLTVCGRGEGLTAAVRAVARATVALVDLREHTGAHPRFGALDVVPWVALEGWPVGPGALDEAVRARDEFAGWAASSLELPCFVYGPERALPAVRREAWATLQPDLGPSRPHPTAGSAAVGARPPLVAYNLWLADPDLVRARQVAAGLRGPAVRALGLQVGGDVQVSCNLIDPWRVGPGAVFDAVASAVAVARAELVGLVPRAVLDREPRRRWEELGLGPSRTIEARLQEAGLDGGRFGREGG